MIKGLSLFSNVGIGEMYLKECGIDIVLANELKTDRAKFYKHVYPECEVICGDIRDKYNEIIETAKKYGCDFLIATPPCQGMSVAGKRDYSDTRNELIIPVLNAIKELEPTYVLIENVVKLLSLKIEYNGKIDTVENIFDEEFGKIYHINKEKIINTQDYGIPQNRKRAIILLSKKGKWEFPQKEKKVMTVRDAIGKLPSVEAIVDGNDNYFIGNKEKIRECLKVNKWHIPKQHAERHVIVMKHTPTGHSAFENEYYYPKKVDGTRVKGYNTTYKRMSWDKPAPTITTTNGVISSQCNVHPGRKLKDGTYSDARALTIYEVMCLFSIKSDWDIPSWANENFIRTVIGEGIPPLLIAKIVNNIEEAL